MCCALGQSQGFGLVRGKLTVYRSPGAARLADVSAGQFRLDKMSRCFSGDASGQCVYTYLFFP